MRKNNIETYDSYLNVLAQPSIEHTFYDVGEDYENVYPMNDFFKD